MSPRSTSVDGALCCSFLLFMCDLLSVHFLPFLTVFNSVQRMNSGENLNIPLSIKNRTLSRGLQSALATGNWGTQPGAPPAKTGVSQVRHLVSTALPASALIEFHVTPSRHPPPLGL